MKRRWVEYNFDNEVDCPVCSGKIEVFTNASIKEIKLGYYHDGDLVRCTEGCSLDNAQISGDSEIGAWVNNI